MSLNLNNSCQGFHSTEFRIDMYDKASNRGKNVGKSWSRIWPDSITGKSENGTDIPMTVYR